MGAAADKANKVALENVGTADAAKESNRVAKKAKKVDTGACKTCEKVPLTKEEKKAAAEESDDEDDAKEEKKEAKKEDKKDEKKEDAKDEKKDGKKDGKKGKGKGKGGKKTADADEEKK